MMEMLTRNFCLFVVLFYASLSFSQPALELKEYQDKYKGESLVNTLNHESIDISIDKNGELKVESITDNEYFFLNSSANNYSKDRVTYSYFREIGDIEAYTMIPEEKKYKRIDVKEFNIEDARSKGIFHDDVKAYSFYFKGLKEGAKTRLKFPTIEKEARFISSFYFGNFIYIENLKFQIVCDNEIKMKFAYFHMKESDIEYTKEVGKKRTTYTFYKEKSDKFKVDSRSPGAAYYLPHIVPRIASYTHNGERKPLLDTPEDLFSWYQELLKMKDNEGIDELKALTDSLTFNCKSEREKVEAIYYWVQKNVKYIAMESGLGGFIPEGASDVCTNKYGDCKGMSNLMHEMFNTQNIPTYLTWIGSNDIPYRYNDTPTPNVDNHMILTYIHEDEYYFLDATGGYVPLGLPTSFIQGKEALIGKGEDFEIKEVGIVPSNMNVEYDSTFIELKETGEIVGKTVHIIEGLNNIYFRQRLASESYDVQKRYLNRLYEKGNNKFIIDSLSIENLDKIDKPIIVKYDFTLNDYVTSYKDEYFLNLIMEDFYGDSEIKEDREVPFKLEFSSQVKFHVELKLPDSYKLSHVPKDVNHESDLFSFSIKYKHQNSNKVSLDLFTSEDYLILYPDRFEEWNEAMSVWEKSTKDSLVLKKK